VPSDGPPPHEVTIDSDFVHSSGRKSTLWFEPERVHQGTWLAEHHPEWVHGGKEGGLLRLGDPACRRWITDTIDRLITEEGIDVYRQDFNISPLGYWRGADPEDRKGITEIRHVEGYLAFWDELLRRHPDLLIDSCASGGRRNDLETLRRSVPMLRSDYPLIGPAASTSDGQQCHTMGLSLWVPHHGTGVGISDAYSMRSAFAPAFRIGWDVRDRTVDLALLRKTVEDFRKTEECWLGDFYPLTRWSLEDDVWAAWQLDRPEAGKGFVQAFRRAGCPYEAARFRLRGLEPDTLYSLDDLDRPEERRRLSGRELMERGLPIALPAPRSSAILLYRKAGGGD
jgi:alpha-galactosidase